MSRICIVFPLFPLPDQAYSIIFSSFPVSPHRPPPQMPVSSTGTQGMSRGKYLTQDQHIPSPWEAVRTCSTVALLTSHLLPPENELLLCVHDREQGRIPLPSEMWCFRTRTRFLNTALLRWVCQAALRGLHRAGPELAILQYQPFRCENYRYQPQHVALQNFLGPISHQIRTQ